MLLFAESFDYAGSATEFIAKWDYWHHYATSAQIGTGRRGTQACRVVDSSSSSYVDFYKSIDNKSTVIVGCAWYFDGGINSPVGCYLRDGTTNQVRYFMNNSTLAIDLYADEVLLGSTANGTLSPHTWHFIEIKTTIHSSNGSVELRVNGKTELSYSGINTQNSGNAYVDNVMWYLKCDSMYANVDDIYICDDTGDVANDFLGDIRVDLLLPDGAGSNTDWTPSTGSNYQCVDEVGPDGDTTYVATTVSGHYDTYSFGNLSAVSGIVYGLQTLAYARKPDGGNLFLRNVLRPASTNYDGDILHALSETYTYSFEVFPNNPETASGWTISEINSSEFGIKLEV